jgi:antitoxin component YwqK of YwqJK toxin-antitoxin module
MNDPHQITVRYRTQSGDGYDTDLINGSIFAYQEYKNGILDGLFVVLHDPNNPSDQEHCGMWSRFVNGKILGKFIMWGKDGKIQNMAEFKEPFDFLKYQTLKMDLSWTEVPTGKTNSIPSSP